MVTLVMMMYRMTLVYRDGDTGDGDEQDDISLLVTLVMMMNRMTLVYRDGDTGDDDEQDDISLQGW